MHESDRQSIEIARQALADFLKSKLEPADVTKASALIATYTASCIRGKLQRPRPASSPHPSVFMEMAEAIKHLSDS